MRARNPWLAAPIMTGLAAGLLSGCGADQSGGAGTGNAIVMGMSDEVTTADPASGYAPGSWLLFNNVFQSLLAFPKGGTTPEPDAAESCTFAAGGSTEYTCVLKDGLKFSNGDALTSKDVKFSFERTLKINDPDGPAIMLTSIGSIDTPDAKTVVFHLNTPDATFPSKIASAAGSIVDSNEYEPDKLRTDNKAVGSGVYTLSSFNKDQAVFAVNKSYKGSAVLQNSGMTMKLYNGDQEALKTALQDGDIDFAFRGLAATDIADIEDASSSDRNGLQVVEGSSAEVQHLVFNMKDPVAGQLAVRQAIAYLVNRDDIVNEVYRATATPLYSVIPAGITGHNTAFFDLYGPSPSSAKAKAALRADGITDRVKITLWSTPVRYGPGTDAEFQRIAQQLNASGLFEADVKSVPLDEYEKGIAAGEYAVYVKGWVPDYPDPDNFTAPFFGEGNVLDNHYTDSKITETLIPATAKLADRAAATDDFAELQKRVAEDIPLLPLWQGKQYAVARQNISGLEWTLDPSTVFRFWEISKG